MEISSNCERPMELTLQSPKPWDVGLDRKAKFDENSPTLIAPVVEVQLRVDMGQCTKMGKIDK